VHTRQRSGITVSVCTDWTFSDVAELRLHVT
jgi:hypothetical protein